MSGLGRPDLTLDDGVLRSAQFDDVYYSAEDGLAESRHVFLAGNDLASRFAALKTGEVFTLGELGFGTGLNVAAAMTAFAQRGHDRGHLHVLTVEGFPLPDEVFRDRARAAAARWPEAAPALLALAEAYPKPVPGHTTLVLSPDVTLTLVFGEAEEALSGMEARVNAFMLDGFSPAKNPAMWSETIFARLAALSAEGATAATFTVAGAVRRGLTAQGFTVRKAPGFGRKRDMLCASLESPPAPERPSAAAPLPLRPLLGRTPPGPVAVLGAGMAGAWLVHALRRRGVETVLYDPKGRAGGASGNPAGLLTPRLEAQDGPLARLYRDAYLFALRAYEREAPDAILGRGALVHYGERRLAKALSLDLWPQGVFEDRGDRAFVENAAAIDPRIAIAALTDGVCLIEGAPEVVSEDGLTLEAGGERRAFAAIVHASGTGATHLPFETAVLTASRGQIDVFAGPRPDVIVSGDGYAAPTPDGLVAGATYSPADPDTAPSPDEESSRANQETARRLLGEMPGHRTGRRASLRAVTPDRHPLAGPLCQEGSMRTTHAALRGGGRPGFPLYATGLFVLAGLGSRGLVTAPLLAEHVSSLMAGGPSILSADEAEKLHPMRFAARALKRGQI